MKSGKQSNFFILTDSTQSTVVALLLSTIINKQYERG